MTANPQKPSTPLSRDDMEGRLLDYLYGELDASERDAFERALPAHPEVAAELERHQWTRAQMARLPVVPLPMGALDQALAAADAAAAAAVPKPTFWERLRRFAVQPAFAMALVLFLGVGVSVYMTKGSRLPSEPAAASDQEGRGAVAVAPEAAAPTEWTARRDQLDDQKKKAVAEFAQHEKLEGGEAEEAVGFADAPSKAAEPSPAEPSPAAPSPAAAAVDPTAPAVGDIAQLDTPAGNGAVRPRASNAPVAPPKVADSKPAPKPDMAPAPTSPAMQPGTLGGLAAGTAGADNELELGGADDALKDAAKKDEAKAGYVFDGSAVGGRPADAMDGNQPLAKQTSPKTGDAAGSAKYGEGELYRGGATSPGRAPVAGSPPPTVDVSVNKTDSSERKLNNVDMLVTTPAEEPNLPAPRYETAGSKNEKKPLSIDDESQAKKPASTPRVGAPAAPEKPVDARPQQAAERNDSKPADPKPEVKPRVAEPRVEPRISETRNNEAPVPAGPNTPPAKPPSEDGLWTTYGQQVAAGAWADAQKTLGELLKMTGDNDKLKAARTNLARKVEDAKRVDAERNKGAADKPLPEITPTPNRSNQY